MESSDLTSEQVQRTNFGRKRKRNPKNYKRNLQKAKKLNGGNHIPRIVCKHNDRCCKASTLNLEDAYALNYKFHDIQSKQEQDAFLLTYMTVSEPRQQKSKGKSRTVSVKYSVITNSNVKLPVCKSSFMSIFGMYK